VSTKCTIDHGDNWHLYEEAIDQTVWIETRGLKFDAHLGLVRIQIPPAVIDAIRKTKASYFPHLRKEQWRPTPPRYCGTCQHWTRDTKETHRLCSAMRVLTGSDWGSECHLYERRKARKAKGGGKR
jgi:hypothetical protein